MLKLSHSPIAEREPENSGVMALWPDYYLLLPREAREQSFTASLL